MPPFTSARERRLWLVVGVVLAAIYATLGLAGSLAQRLGPESIRSVQHAFFLNFVATIVVGLWAGWRPGRRETAVGLAIAAVYTAAVLRLFLNPAERTHLFEYGVVAVLIHLALTERKANGRRVPAPAGFAILLTTLAGWVDEGIQSLLPQRHYDLVDVGFNALAATLAVTAKVALAWARRGDGDSGLGAAAEEGEEPFGLGT